MIKEPRVEKISRWMTKILKNLSEKLEKEKKERVVDRIKGRRCL